MLFLGFLPEMSIWLSVVFDTLLLTFLSSILIYHFILKDNSRLSLTSALEQLDAINEMMVISITDPTGKITFANDQFVKISGYSQKELLGNNYRIINCGFHSKEFFNELWATIKKGLIWRGEIKNKTKSGEFYWVDTAIVPILDKNNQIKKFVTLRTDITKRKKLEETLKLEQAKVAHMSKLATMGEVASGVAHEVNNPLSVILGKVTILKKEIEKKSLDVEKINKDLDAILENVNRISRIVKNLIGFSRKNSDTEIPYKISVEDLFENALSLVQEKIKSNEIELIVESKNLDVFCLSSQVEQVLVNLLNNSAYAVSGFSERWIRLSAEDRGEFVEISVTDSGKGIPSEVVEKLMQPFFTTKPVGQGTGLGLHISKRIIESQAGSFFYAQASQNTKFTIMLPKSKYSIISILDIEDAKLSHMNWKTKILVELTSKVATLDSKEICDCTVCKLGKWISASERMFTDNENYNQLKESHKLFHQCAGELVDKIHQGEREEVEKNLSWTDSKYNRYSNEVLHYLDLLKKEET